MSETFQPTFTRPQAEIVNSLLNGSITPTLNGAIFSQPITGYSGSAITPIQGQLGYNFINNSTTSRTLTASLQSIMTTTFDKGVGVWLVTGHYRLASNIGTTDCAVLTTLVVDAASHFYYTNLNTNTLGVIAYHSVPFSMVFTTTTTTPFTISVNALYSTAPSSGSVITGGSSDARYAALQVVRIA